MDKRGETQWRNLIPANNEGAYRVSARGRGVTEGCDGCPVSRLYARFGRAYT